jgi:hypothetical protein
MRWLRCEPACTKSVASTMPVLAMDSAGRALPPRISATSATPAERKDISILRTPVCSEGFPALADFRIINELNWRRRRPRADRVRLPRDRPDCKNCHN